MASSCLSYFVVALVYLNIPLYYLETHLNCVEIELKTRLCNML